LDRQALGARIFANPEERAALNALLHPLIQQAFLEKTQALAERGLEVVVYDAPLLIENRLHEWMNGVVLVYVPREVQLARLMARNALTRAQAEERLAAQLPLEDKRAHATWIVDNSGELSGTRAQVEDVWRSILAGR
jgi:dephospho-CoA kinase